MEPKSYHILNPKVPRSRITKSRKGDLTLTGSSEFSSLWMTQRKMTWTMVLSQTSERLKRRLHKKDIHEKKPNVKKTSKYLIYKAA